MQITLVTVGSRGDVQPYIALGAGLARAGHHVRLATHGRFEALIRSRGVEFAEIRGDPRQAVESDVGQSWLDSGGNPLKFALGMARIMRPLLAGAIGDTLDACRDADVMLYSPLGWLGAHHVAEKLGVHAVPAYYVPFTPTGAFPAITAPIRANLGPMANRMSYLAGEQVFWSLFRRVTNAARQDVLGLPPMPRHAPFAGMRRRSSFALYGFSPTVIPPPRDWPEGVHVTGYWFLDAGRQWDPPPALSHFLAAGPRPVYVGFGSMHARNAGEVTRIVVEALDRAGQRGVVLTGWGALRDEALPESVYALEHVPHDWLFPQVGAVVHHAGAGTSGAGVRAGVPTVPVPFFADQPFWARRLRELGVATKPVPFQRLSAPRLAAAIRRAVEDDGLRERSALVGERVRAEDGVGRAVELIDALRRRHRMPNTAR